MYDIVYIYLPKQTPIKEPRDVVIKIPRPCHYQILG